MRTLRDFCGLLACEIASSGQLEPETAAIKFREYFQLPHRPDREELTRLLEEGGIGTVSGGQLPHGLRGIHFSAPEGGYDIRYSLGQWKGAQEHTLLHETYEIIHETLADMFDSCPTSTTLCADADKFAAATLMSPDLFRAIARASGLDVVEIQKHYNRSYASVALRLTEVMKDQPMLVVLYERSHIDAPMLWPSRPMPGAFRATVVRRTEGFGAIRDPLIGGTRGSLPIKGSRPLPGSLTFHVFQNGRAAHAESAWSKTGDGSGALGRIAVAARPVIWYGHVAKVAVIAVPEQDRTVIRPQLTSTLFDLPGTDVSGGHVPPLNYGQGTI